MTGKSVKRDGWGDSDDLLACNMLLKLHDEGVDRVKQPEARAGESTQGGFCHAGTEQEAWPEVSGG
jgi:hypothetical protein